MTDPGAESPDLAPDLAPDLVDGPEPAAGADLVAAPDDETEPQAPVRRPVGLWLLTAALLASPLLHLAALLLGRHWLNFGSQRVWDGFVYFLIAPIVGWLMLRRHERARFSVYVFLSCEILRAVRIHSHALGILAVGSILYLQLPAARRFHPSVDPRRVLRRIGLRGGEPAD